ncbi:tetratricopeptide repeat-containing sulfotransferase family protein [Mangrovibacter plantisponsor]|uniref:Tfp pilus assembly protein PilF n=1 Tax=Mangrovibacter plantisponsor TaxID=451513 RepID=A0A317Q0V0_9ENTR|nr:tetratricopeptide repeat-containing sulfotransferase family protein [Mangrovibacter plantisponsor]PWW09550.1 Tfp pilus assembly protein PilF [Mangrovibacter plantisponsor]
MSNSNPLDSQQLTVLQALELANAHWNAGQAAQAEQLCLRVLEVAPLQHDALNLLGLMMHAYGMQDQAIDYIRKACQSPEAPALIFSNLAELYRQKGLLLEAEQAARLAVEQEPELVVAWSNLGIILQEAGKFTDSLECLEYVVSLQPDNAEAHNNLANTCQRLGYLQRARESYQRALELRPEYAEVYSNLTLLLSDLGCIDEAAASARRAIDINPQLADAYLNLANIELSRMRYADARHWVNSLLEFAPQHVGGLTALAQIMIIDERYEDAVTFARKSLAITPDNANAHKVLGKARQGLGHYEEAEQAYNRAAELPGTVAEEALVARSVLLMEMGDKDAASAGFELALKRFPGSHRIVAARCDNKFYQPGDPDIDVMEAALAREPALPLNEQMLLHFSLGKAYLDINESERAFFHLDRGNAIKRATFSYDAEQISVWMKSVADVFTPALMERFRGAGAASERPVFIIGMPRSGTTLIEQILASHPGVCGAGELGALGRAVARGGRFPDDVASWGHGHFLNIGADYLEQTSHLAPDALRVVDKLPGNFLYAGLIPLLMQGARIIHCRRDPVDTCLSCYSKLFSGEQLFAYQLDELGQFYLDYQALMTHFRRVLPPECFIEVDYETVVDDLEGQARRLIDFINLPWDDACLAFYETRRIVRTASVAQVRQPIYASSRGRWHRHATHLGPLLDVLGVEQK